MIRPALALLLLALGGCGFRPLYASVEGEADGGALGRVEVGPIRGPRDARDLMRDTLASRFPPMDGDERYVLAVNLDEVRQAVSVTIDNNARRFNYQLTGNILYLDRETGEQRTQNLQSVVSFAIVPSQYASLVGREDAVRRAVIDLARKIETDAALYAQGRATQTSEGGLFRGNTQRDPLRAIELEEERSRQEAEQASRDDEAGGEAP